MLGDTNEVYVNIQLQSCDLVTSSIARIADAVMVVWSGGPVERWSRGWLMASGPLGDNVLDCG